MLIFIVGVSEYRLCRSFWRMEGSTFPSLPLRLDCRSLTALPDRSLTARRARRSFGRRPVRRDTLSQKASSRGEHREGAGEWGRRAGDVRGLADLGEVFSSTFNKSPNVDGAWFDSSDY